MKWLENALCKTTMPIVKQLSVLKLLGLLGIIFSLGCSGTVPATPTLAPVALPSATAESPSTAESIAPTPTLPPEMPTATPPEPAPLPPPQYDLTASLNYGQHSLHVEEKIQYSNRSNDPMAELVLIVEALNYPGVFQLRGMTWANGKPIQDFRNEDTRLILPLETPLLPGGSIGLAITYDLLLPSPVPNPSIRPIPFGFTSKQTNLVDWYPFIPPYQDGRGWQFSPAGYFGEHLAYEASDFRVNIQIVDQRGDLKVAASAAPQVDGPWLRYQHEAARNFAWSVSPDYVVVTQTVGNTEVIGYAFTVHQAAGEAVLRTTAESLELYQRLFGPYPRQTLTVVEADFLDGMEYDGLYFLSNGFYNLYTGTPGEYLIAIAAHETAHQWWYALVGNDQAQDPWLDEALCTYSERLFYENLHPEALEWWWAYRVNYYQPKGMIDGSIYSFAGTAEPYRSYRDAVYLNGALFLEELRKTIGDDTFFKFLQSYAQENAYQIATNADFFASLKSHTAADLSGLISRYFAQP